MKKWVKCRKCNRFVELYNGLKRFNTTICKCGRYLKPKVVKPKNDKLKAQLWDNMYDETLKHVKVALELKHTNKFFGGMDIIGCMSVLDAMDEEIGSSFFDKISEDEWEELKEIMEDEY